MRDPLAQACDNLATSDETYSHYVKQVVDVSTVHLADAPSDSAGPSILQLEIVHTDTLCHRSLADACVNIIAMDADVRFFVLPDHLTDNGVSYWDRAGQASTSWEPMAPDQISRGAEVSILGQTLPSQLSPVPGAGYLHPHPGNPGDGWTVRVGMSRLSGAPVGTGVQLSVRVAARPYPSPHSNPFTLTV